MHDEPIIVLGAGLAGLAAAALLARAGHRVEVLEAAGAPGGRARSREVDGARVNLGAHALYLRGPGMAVLDELGIDLPGRPPPVGGARTLLDGRLARPGSAGAGGVRAVLGAAGRLLAATRTPPDPAQPVAAWLDEVVGDGQRRTLAEAYVRVASYGWAPEVQSAEVAREQLRAASPVRYLDGGWQSLVDGLAVCARRAGARVEVGAAPRAVVVDDAGAVRGVRRGDGSLVGARGVVVAVGSPTRTAALLADTPVAAAATAAADAAQPVRVATLDVVLRRRHPGHVPVVVGLDEPVFLTTASDTTPHGSDGRVVLHMTRHLPLGARTGAADRGAMEAVLDLAAPAWRELATDVAFLPGLTVSQDVAAAAAGGLRGRPTAAVAGVRGLAIAGDWVGPRGYLAQAALCSAADAATAVVAASPAGLVTGSAT